MFVNLIKTLFYVCLTTLIVLLWWPHVTETVQYGLANSAVKPGELLKDIGVALLLIFSITGVIRSWTNRYHVPEPKSKRKKIRLDDNFRFPE